MTERGLLITLVILLLLTGEKSALGHGFGIYNQGAKASAMSTAFVAQADDPSAIYYNPAGIVQLEGTQVSVGANAFAPSATFKSDGTSGIPGTSANQSTEFRDKT